MANVADGEATRLQVNRISAAGVGAVGTLARSSLWCALGSWETTLPAVTHDGSVSLSYFRNIAYGYCAANYSATGDLRWLRCGGNAAAISPAADDDLYIVARHPAPGQQARSNRPGALGSHRHHYPSAAITAAGSAQRQLRRALEQHHPHLELRRPAASVRSAPPVCLYQTPARDLRLINAGKSLQPGRDTWTGLREAMRTTSTVTRHIVDGLPSRGRQPSPSPHF